MRELGVLVFGRVGYQKARRDVRVYYESFDPKGSITCASRSSLSLLSRNEHVCRLDHASNVCVGLEM